MTAPADSAEAIEPLVRKRLSACQIRLSDRHSFFGTLLMMSPVELTEDIPTAATNGREILFNPQFVQGLTAAEDRECGTLSTFNVSNNEVGGQVDNQAVVAFTWSKAHEDMLVDSERGFCNCAIF